MFSVEKFSVPALKLCKLIESLDKNHHFDALSQDLSNLFSSQYEEIHQETILQQEAGVRVSRLDRNPNVSPKHKSLEDMQELLYLLQQISQWREDLDEKTKESEESVIDNVIRKIFKNTETVTFFAESSQILQRFRENYQEELSLGQKRKLEALAGSIPIISRQAEETLEMLRNENAKSMEEDIIGLIRQTWKEGAKEKLGNISQALLALNEVAKQNKIKWVQIHSSMDQIFKHMSVLHAIAEDKAVASVLLREGGTAKIIAQYRPIYEKHPIFSKEETEENDNWVKAFSNAFPGAFIDKENLLSLVREAAEATKPPEWYIMVEDMSWIGTLIWSEQYLFGRSDIKLDYDDDYNLMDDSDPNVEERIAANRSRLRELGYNSTELTNAIKEIHKALAPLPLQAICLQAVNRAQRSRGKSGG